MIVQQSSNENSVIMDCFCGSGSFLEAGKNIIDMLLVLINL